MVLPGLYQYLQSVQLNNNNNKRFIPRQYPTVQRRLQEKNLNINT